MFGRPSLNRTLTLRHVLSSSFQKFRASTDSGSSKRAEPECRNWTRVHKCNCRARERRDDQLAAQGRLLIIQRLKEEKLLKIPEYGVPAGSKKRMKTLPPEEFPLNKPGNGQGRPVFEGCHIPKCDCISRESEANKKWAEGSTSIAERLSEEDGLHIDSPDWTDHHHDDFPLNRPKKKP